MTTHPADASSAAALFALMAAGDTAGAALLVDQAIADHPNGAPGLLVDALTIGLLAVQGLAESTTGQALSQGQLVALFQGMAAGLASLDSPG